MWWHASHKASFPARLTAWEADELHSASVLGNEYRGDGFTRLWIRGLIHVAGAWRSVLNSNGFLSSSWYITSVYVTQRGERMLARYQTEQRAREWRDKAAA